MSSNQTTGFLEIQNTEENLWYKQDKNVFLQLMVMK